MKYATEVMKKIGVNDITGDMLMQQLDFQTRKLVEIAKVVMKQPQILVIDETSTALSHDGREILYDIMNRFRKENKSVIFISHDLDEIMEVCDTLTVLRDGKIIRTFNKEEFEAGAIRSSMIGRELQGDYYRSDFEASAQQEVALNVKNLVYTDRLKGVSFQVRRGEIVGVGGLAHCGMHTLGKVCFGAVKPEEGNVSVADGTVIDSPAKAMKKRMGYVSKDRDVESLCLNASIEDNISIAGMSKFAVKDFLVLKNREKKYVNQQIEELSIKCSGRDQAVSQLSGGNKQKVVFGKWIGCGSEILILDCPTRGVDIGVKQAMYQLMVKLKSAKVALRMLLEQDPDRVSGLADELKELNDVRKDMTAKGETEAIEQVERFYMSDKVLVVFLPECHESLAGIIAGRLREHFHKPSFVLTRGEQSAKGSGRSIEAYHMYQGLCEVSDLLVKFGGHPMAAGLSIEESDIDEFRRRLNENAKLTEDDFVPQIWIDVPMPFEYVNEKIVDELKGLEPFGQGNEKPLFAQKSLTIRNVRVLGKNRNVVKMNLVTNTLS